MDMATQQLADLLTEAAEAHHEYEAKRGEKDEDWALWYAEYILAKLEGEAGDEDVNGDVPEADDEPYFERDR